MSSISTTDSHEVTGGPKITGFVILTIVALAACGGALYIGNAPLTSPFVADWFDWLRTEPTWPIVFGVSVIVLIVGLAGMIARLISGVAASASRPRTQKAQLTAAPSPFDTAVSVPAEPVNTRASLKFDAETMAASGLVIPATAVEAVPTIGTQIAEPPSMEISTVELRSLEPAIFSDNASDSFLTRQPEAAPEKPAFDADAALSETHGLQITSAQVIPIRPDVKIETVAEAAAHDPVEAALLAEPAAVEPRAVPPSDINAVVSSARAFLDAPEGAPVAVPEAPVAVEAPVVEVPVVEVPVVEMPATVAEAPVELSGFHAVAAAMEPADDQAVIRQAVQMALSVWPDTTRAIAADELGVRVAYLYYDKAPQSAQAFQQIASGELSAAANTLQSHAADLMQSGQNPQAAEVWRVIGALNMGRDDPKALTAYENVSECDPTDANIHVYLARRYQMSNETGKLLPVLQRALTVIGDPSTRLELLAPYADLKLKDGDLQAAGDAFEELGRLHETRAYLKPDDVQARSAQGIALARGAQTREMQGAFDLAGPLYKKAHTVFSDLSAQLPDHAGLRNMAENAHRDAQRFQMA